MTVSYRIDSHAGIVYSALTGSVTDEELCYAAEKLWSDPAYCPDFFRLIDLSQADFNHITPEPGRRTASYDCCGILVLNHFFDQRRHALGGEADVVSCYR